MFKNWIRNIKAWCFNKFYTYTLSPKGKAMMNYLANDLKCIPQQRIDAYDNTIQYLETHGITKEELFMVLAKGDCNTSREERDV